MVFALAAGCGESTGDTNSKGGEGGGGAGTTNGGGGGAGAGTSSSGGATASGGAGGSGGSTGSGGTMTTSTTEVVIGGNRPVKMYIPESYDGSKAVPLAILLHGYGASGAIQETYFALKNVAAERGFIYAVADGTKDATGKQFWNATDACCGFGMTNVDDSTYLSGVIDEIKAAYKIDAKRVYFVGHSNGGFMSYRMACDHADQIAAIASLAGATFVDEMDCNPKEPVAVLQIHGNMDETVAYPGGTFAPGFTYPSAKKTVETWATYGGCSLSPVSGGALDIESSLAGKETSVEIYSNGCQPGGHAELWTVAGGKHIPSLTVNFKQGVFDFFEAHPKP